MNRRAAAEEARDTSKPTLTHRITLVQDDQQRAGTLLLVPLYRRGMPVGTVAEPRAAHFGWIYAPLVMDEVVAELNSQLSDEVSLFLSETEGARQATIVGAADTQRDRVSTSLTLSGRAFTATWAVTAAFQRERNCTARVLVFGLAVTALLSMLVYRQQAAARAAMALAAENGELFEAAPAALLTIDEYGVIVRANTTAQDTFAAATAISSDGTSRTSRRCRSAHATRTCGTTLKREPHQPMEAS